MGSKELAEKILLGEEQARNTERAFKNAVSGLEDSLKGIAVDIRKLVPVNKEDLLPKDADYFPPSELYYQTGIVTISSSTSLGNYPEFLNIITDLGRPSVGGSFTNLGPGKIFLVFSDNGIDISGNEQELKINTRLVWEEDSIRYIHARTDTNDTQYQVVAG